jgi:hypothetical protein
MSPWEEEEPPESSFLFAHSEKGQCKDITMKKDTIYKPGGKASLETNSDGTLILDIQPPELWEREKTKSAI